MKIHGNNPPGGGPPSTPPGGGPDKAHGHHHEEQREFDAVFDQIIKEQDRQRQEQQEFEQRRIIEEEAKKKSQNRKSGDEILRDREYNRKGEASELKSEDAAEGELEAQETGGENTKNKTYKQVHAEHAESEQIAEDNEPTDHDAGHLERKAARQPDLVQQQGQQTQGAGKKDGQKIQGDAKQFKPEGKGEEKSKLKDTTIGNNNTLPKTNGESSTGPAGDPQKTGLSKAFNQLVEHQEGHQPGPEQPQQGLEENPGLDRAMNKLQEKLLEGDGSLKTGAEEKLHTEKIVKTFTDQKIERTDLPLGQTLPLSAYLEAPGKPIEVQPPGQGQLNIAHIEKLVDQMMVGVNATGDPEIKMSLHVPELGQLEVKITRGEEGMLINLNTQNETAGQQLGQNISALQESLIQRGIQINNIQLLVQNQPIPISELLDSFRPNADPKILRKDPTGRVSRENKKDRPQSGPPPKGR